MKGMIKRWLKEVLNETEGGPALTVAYPEPIRKAQPTAQDAVSSMATSMATVYRIDNGFIVFVNMTSEAHLGTRGSLVYAKDAQEVAEKIVAHEAAFKLTGGVQRGGIASAAYLLHNTPQPPKLNPQLWSDKLLTKYKGAYKDV